MWKHSILIVICFAVHAQSLEHSPPLITKQPPVDELLYKVSSEGSDKDKPFIIECEAEGEPAPRYEWIKNGKTFDWATYDDRISNQQGRGTLVITAPRDEDLGQYQCFAINEHGIASSNSVFVRKSDLNSFKDDVTKNVTANEGQPFKMECSPPDGWPKPTVHWLILTTEGSIKSINNSRMTLDPEGNLWFSNVTRVDTSTAPNKNYFYYVCSATSQFRNEYKLGNRVLLDVVPTSSSISNQVSPTQQYVSRKDEVALRGERIELYCIYGGTPLPQIVWSKNGQGIKWSDRVSQGNYGKSLIIRPVMFEDRGEYTCEASNGVGNAQSYSINLDIWAKPYFTKAPKIVVAAEEEEALFECEATGVPQPTISWVFNGKPIAQAPNNARRTIGTNYIKIADLKKGDTGNYGCNATNSLGYVYKDVYLNVLAVPPTIQIKPQIVATVDRRNVTMVCRIFGAPKPAIKWIHNSLTLTGGRYRVLPSGDLEIEDVSFSDAGDYQCYATNKFGSIDANGTLIVKDSTRITDEPQDFEAVAGNSATFRCNAISDPGLNMSIIWIKNGVEIEKEDDSRFVQSNDNSLTITKTTELDSGEYTCLAKTKLDEVSAKATLIVQDAPNPPDLLNVDCHSHDATISWRPKGDNRAPILHYTIQYNTSFTPNTWEAAYEKVPSTEFTYSVGMSPWANYTFRVIAYNKIGPSKPSKHSGVCTTQPDVPYKNPDNVEGRGNQPTNLIIRWTPMPEIEHNGPKFGYKVFWKRDAVGGDFESREIKNWTITSYEVLDQPVFQKYRIKVIALNDVGASNVAAHEVIGWSGEDRPDAAPGNFTVVQVTGPNTAVLRWDPVTNESVHGHFKGYKIETWTEEFGETNIQEFQLKENTDTALVNIFKPASKNYARIFVYNGQYHGPPSNQVFFMTEEGRPGTVQSFEAVPLGSSALWLSWKKPLQPNGQLTGYKIYYEEVKGTQLLPRIDREPHIDDPKITSVKLAGLSNDAKYRLRISATTKAGEGEQYFIEARTLPANFTIIPEAPVFYLEKIPSESASQHGTVKIQWRPNQLEGRSGSHFFVKYRQKGGHAWTASKNEMNEDFLIVRGLEPEESYEFRLVAVDGIHNTEGASQFIDITGIDGPVIVKNNNVATAGWFIGMILALAFLILILSIICIIKRNRGGKYDVHDREVANGRRDFDEGGFHEYSQPLDNKSAGRQSTSSNVTKPGPESDTDSMAEYGEGDTAGQFTEDGSFIGQYVPGKLQQPVSPQPIASNPTHQTGSGGGGGSSSMATYV